jgi:hypothetical protein
MRLANTGDRQMQTFTATASNGAYFIDLCVLAPDAKSANEKFCQFLATYEYADEELAAGEYTLDPVEQDDEILGWAGTPSEEEVKIIRSGVNG